MWSGERRRRRSPCSRSSPPSRCICSRHGPAELCVLEVGLGGRGDATNVVARPAACAITSISLDHREMLGDTLEAIAAEKAGILKPGVPVAIGAQPDAVRAVLLAHAAAVGAPVHLRGPGLELDGLRYTDADGTIDLPPLVPARRASARQCRHRHRRPARVRPSREPPRRFATEREGPNGQGGCKGCAAARSRLPPVGSCGWTAATTQVRAKPWPRIWRAGPTGRSISSSA